MDATIECEAPTGDAFPVVGLGASAGGLDALRRLLTGIPADCGIAFVVVQHLSPDHDSMMVELLGKYTPLTVEMATNEVSVEPGKVYLIPPRAEMIISCGRLLLTDRDARQAVFLPIDSFFRSLADDLGPRAVAVVLSGTGSDGSRGVRVVHAAGGLVMAQSVDSAEFTSMPRAAVDTRVADFVGDPDELRAELIELTANGGFDAVTPGPSIESIFDVLCHETGIDFTQYKVTTVARRLERRARMLGIEQASDYARRVLDDPEERSRLYRDLLIGVTSFFRDKEAFEILSTEVFPPAVANLAAGKELRVWSVACATGEEAYSLAICALEAFRAIGREPRGLRVFATDVHAASLDHAAAGVYAEEAIAGLPHDICARYFNPAGSGRVQVSNELRSAVVFGIHNVLRDAPFTKIDVLACRNLLIYLDSDAQRRVLALLHFALVPGGVLMLGPSESPSELDDEFVPISARWRLYRKRRDVRLLRELHGWTRTGFVTRRAQQSSSSPAEQAAETLLGAYAPPSLLVSRDHIVLHSFAGGGELLRQPDGAASLRVLDLVDGDIRDAVWGALHRLQENRELIVRAQVAKSRDGASGSSGSSQPAIPGAPAVIEARSLGDAVLVSFVPETARASDSAPDRLDGAAARIHALEEELRATRRELHGAMEKVEIANEELLASNEELRSTNEELQSVNEELQTVNAEYETKIDELTEMTADFKHLLAATDVYFGFLDADLKLRKFTPPFAEVFHLVETDVGRRISGFAHSLRMDGFVDELARVLATGAPYQAEIQREDGAWLLMRVTAYERDSERAGVVVTLVDIERIKRAELRYRALVQSSDALVWTMDPHGQVVDVLPGIADYLGVEPLALFGEGGFDSVHPDERPQIYQQWRAAIASGDSYHLECRMSRGDSGKYRRTVIHGAPVRDDRGVIVEWVSTMSNVEAERSAQDRASELDSTLHGILAHSPVPIFLKDLELRYRFASEAFARDLGLSLIERTDAEVFGETTAVPIASHDRQVLDEREVLRADELLPVGGDTYVFDVVKFPVYGGDGALVGVAGVATDVTAQRLAQAQDQRALLERDQFIAMMSHELRTPLAAIVHAVGVADSNPAGDSASRARAIIARQAGHLARLVDDLLDVARMEKGKLRLMSDDCDLRAVVTRCIEAFEYRFMDASVALLRELPDAPVEVRGDADRIAQVFDNLLANALRFTDAGGRVAIQLVISDGDAVVTVADDGAGISPDEMPKIFKPFFQREQSPDRPTGGIGIGLALARWLVEAHGGTLTAESEGLERGAVFRVVLPLARDAADSADTIATPAEPRADRARPTDGRLIVLVEDDQDSREMLSLLLKRSGYRVETAADGPGGLDLILRLSPAFALIDVGLPGMDGYQVARGVREQLGSAPYLVALTGYGRTSDRRASSEAGFDEHLVKPVESTRIEELIQARAAPRG